MNLIDHVINSFNRANTFQTKLPTDVFEMDGMSGAKTRIFYNELCSIEFEGRKTEYLEVGTWKGSTLCSALCFNPNCHATVIENWSEFNGPKYEFETNIKKVNALDRLDIFEEDVFSFDVGKIAKPIDIYLYDGAHDEESHFKAITHIWPALANDAIIIIDDWNPKYIREATFRALESVGARIIQKFEITYTIDGQHTPIPIAQMEFWNGIGVFVVSKISQ